jgi:hypothetical protein
MADELNEPVFQDWLKCYHVTIEVISKVFREIGVDAVMADTVARKILARLAAHDPPISVDWLEDKQVD